MNYKLKNLQNKKIAILGLGIENYALVKFLLVKKIKCEISICDARSKDKLGEKYKELAKYKNISWQLEENYNKNLCKFNILFRSPGWPLNCRGIQEAIKKFPDPAYRTGRPLYQGGVSISSPMKLFFDLCPTRNIIGVSGTKGKGTTSSLIYEILKIANKKVYLGGNIGIAPFEFLGKIKKNDWVVLELSSFQLEDMEKSPHIAVITNFSSEHLAPADPNNPNYHKNLKSYWDAKINIVKYQEKGDYAILNPQLATHSSQLKVKSKKIYFKKSNLPSKLIGEHNKENLGAAVEVAKIVGIKDNIIKKAVAGFKGLEHRLEFVKSIKGVKYYNDTFATTPESAITALKSFNNPIVLIAGGSEKNSDFKEFIKEVKKRVKTCILIIGDATPRIRKELLKMKYPENKIIAVSSMKEAVKEARNQAKKGDIVLLSPACASFGIFKNYKERGMLFKEAVKNL